MVDTAEDVAPKSSARYTPTPEHIAKMQEGRRRAKAGRKKGDPSTKELRETIADALRQLAGSLAVAAVAKNMVVDGVPAPDPKLLYDAEVIASNADDLATELVRLGEKNPAILSALIALFRASEWAKLATLVIGIVVPIAANHGLIPAEIPVVFGMPSPPSAESDVSANGHSVP